MGNLYFVTSDIHGFFDVWMAALKEAGFDESNPEHHLIVLGDLFDRGSQNFEVYSYLRDFSASRKVLIRGNHEDIFRDTVSAGMLSTLARRNGTDETIRGLYGYWQKADEYRRTHPELDGPYGFERIQARMAYSAFLLDLEMKAVTSSICREIAQWISSRQWRDYLETPHHVFTHAFLPIDSDHRRIRLSWRRTTAAMWKEARWIEATEPWMRPYLSTLQKQGKTLVVGHRATSLFYNNWEYDGRAVMNYNWSNPIYRTAEMPGLIAIDALTVCTHKVNVLVLREEEL